MSICRKVCLWLSTRDIAYGIVFSSTALRDSGIQVNEPICRVEKLRKCLECDVGFCIHSKAGQRAPAADFQGFEGAQRGGESAGHCGESLSSNCGIQTLKVDAVEGQQNASLMPDVDVTVSN